MLMASLKRASRIISGWKPGSMNPNRGRRSAISSMANDAMDSPIPASADSLTSSAPHRGTSRSVGSSRTSDSRVAATKFRRNSTPIVAISA